MKQQRISGSSQDRQKSNKSSTLLSAEENELVFSLLGRKCLSMCTAVAQLYTTEPPLHSQWLKRYTGALCFVKDSAKRSYYCRIYCLMRSELVWEHEMYDMIEIHQLKPYLLAFEGKDNMIALNFAFEEEAESFYGTTTSIIFNRNRRREDRRNTRVKRNPPPRPTTAAPVPQTNNDEETSSVVLRNPPLITNTTTTTTAPAPVLLVNQGNLISEKKRGNRKLTKADIGMPTNFKHLTHVGWSAQRGFDLTGDDVETLKPFLQKAGVSDQQLKDRETRAFIYDFIQNHNVLESVKSEGDPTKVTKGQTPPPVPTRNQHHSQNGTQRIAPPPPPPPTRQQAPCPPPLPTTTPPSRGPPPSRPPPITTNSTSTAPPPPPPPPMMPPPPPPVINMEVLTKSTVTTDGPDPRSALMDSIRKGRTLKKVDQISNSSAEGGEDSRNDLLSEIRQGIALRPASTREPNTTNRGSSGAGTDALADALRRALQERGRVIRSSDEDSDESSENDGEWDD